jgi:hypothetical protein
MTRQDRLRATAAAWVEVEAQLRFEGGNRLPAFIGMCAQAIAGAAMWLDRDPTQLAELLEAGEIADMIRQAEMSLGLPLYNPTPREEVQERLLAAAEWADAERQRIERQFQKIVTELSALSSDLRKREAWDSYWERRWPIVREEWMPWMKPSVSQRDDDSALQAE